MYKVYSILIIVFLFLSGANAQEYISEWDNETYKRMSVTLNNGTILKGFGKVALVDVDDLLYFKKNEIEGNTLYDFNDIKYLTIKVNNQDRTFEYKTFLGEWSKLVEKIIVGKVTLYQGYYDLTSTDSKRVYYLSKKDNDDISSVKSGDTYNRSIQGKIYGFTHDCPVLKKKLTSKYFKRYGIKDIVNFYNNNCSNKK
jgi:hypothetical protein